jgi:predicted NACHT family NTPase
VELYAEICEVFLGKRQQARGLELDMTPAQKQRVLQPLAYVMMCRQLREVPVAEAAVIIQKPLVLVSPQIVGADFLKAVEQTSGLLLERENGVYSFAHLTFQEYLASVHIREQRLEGELQQQVGNSWWHETIRLYAAQVDATPILEACLADDKPSVNALTLAIECCAEAREIRPDIRERLDRLLNQGIEDADPERRRIVAEALLAQRLHSLIRIDEDRYVDTTLVTHAEYQLFLDDIHEQEEYYRPDDWLEHQFPHGQGRTPVLGVRLQAGSAYCKWLTQRELGRWIYRLPFLEELNIYKLPTINRNVLTEDGQIVFGGILLVREGLRYG